MCAYQFAWFVLIDLLGLMFNVPIHVPAYSCLQQGSCMTQLLDIELYKVCQFNLVTCLG